MRENDRWHYTVQGWGLTAASTEATLTNWTNLLARERERRVSKDWMATLFIIYLSLSLSLSLASAELALSRSLIRFTFSRSHFNDFPSRLPIRVGGWWMVVVLLLKLPASLFPLSYL